MTDENSLYSDPKQPDEFRTESPLRAFAEYTEFGGWLIAKGFRPSMQHLVRYLAAMERREGYRMVQILEAATGVPTMIFRTTARAPLDVVSDVFKASEIERGNAEITEESLKGNETYEKMLKAFLEQPMTVDGVKVERKIAMSAALGAGYGNATFSGPKDDWPYVHTWSHDKEGNIDRALIEWHGQRFDMVPVKGEIDHSSHYVVEWFDNVTQTVHRQPVAEWPEWAQKLVNALPYEKAEEIPDVKITFKGLDPETTHWTRAQWNGDPDDAVNRLRRGDKKMRLAHRNFLEREGCDSTQQYWHTASVASMLRLIDFMEMWDEVSLADCISDEELYKAIGRECPEARAACNADPMAAIEHEVTSQSPVDVLETMAEDIADDLGIEVDRDSFHAAREHLEEMVPVKTQDEVLEEATLRTIRNDPNSVRRALGLDEVLDVMEHGHSDDTPLIEDAPRDVYFNLESGNFYHRTTNRGMGMTFHNKWWDRRNEFVTKDANGRFVAPEKAEMKFDDANPAHYNGWECGDIGERLSANGYQILKYCWRLGKKDDPCKELTKALRYLDREVDWLKTTFPYHTVLPIVVGIAPSNRLNYLLDRTAGQSQFTADVARFLWEGYTHESLSELKAMITDHKFHLDCGNGLAI